VALLQAIHAKRVTIQAKDMIIVRRMRLHMMGYSWAGNPTRDKD
jgi:histone H3/H4